MNISLFIFAGAALASAFLLVVLYRQDKLSGAAFDPEAYWRAPRRAVVLPIARTALLHGSVAASLAVLCVAVWGRYASQFGLPALPPETADFMRWTEPQGGQALAPLPRVLAQTSLLHYVATGWISIFFLSTVSRCLERQLYDLFISYKSQDVALARRIAEACIAAGWNVWFAEYRILLERRAQFLPMFGLGALDSTYGLLVTNDRWAQSKHCKREARLLLATMSPERIFELQAPRQTLPHKLFPRLAQSAALETTEVAQVVKFVESRTDLPACPDHLLPIAPPASSSARFNTACEGRPCSIDVGQWDLFGDPASLPSVSWRYKHLPAGMLEGTVAIFPMRAEQIAADKRWGLGEEFIFDVMAHHARKTMKRQKGLARGAHLYFYQDRPQMGLTHWGGDHPAWHRNIMLDVQNAATGQAAHFHFFFRFNGSFRAYCQHAHLMDALALSLQWT